FFSRHQPAEDRIAVEAGIAPPDEARVRIDQCGRAAVADDGEIKPVICHSAEPSAAMRSSQARTDSGLSKWPLASAKTRPTEKPKPPKREMMPNTGSSVISSPMKIGLRSANGAKLISSHTAPALLMPAGLISTTNLPGRISTEPDSAPAQIAS